MAISHNGKFLAMGIENILGARFMNEREILLEKSEGVATITLNRPEKKNAFTLEMIDRWREALEQWRKDPEVKVIIVTGTGEAFCSGVDFSSTAVKEGRDGPFEHKSVLWDRIHRIALALDDIDKPVIAAMKGVAIGAGLDMALMCDLRFAADTARFSEGYVKVGLVPGDGGAYYLPRLVGIAKALELFWTGDFVDAKEALRIGMVNRVYPAEKLMEETRNFARRLAEGPSEVIRITKRATYQSSRVDLKTALDMISSHMGVIRFTKDSRDAMNATMKKFGSQNKTSK
jgi:2-(1,2-epoxy-1,2-dihydrophenyl)acetyl-CoA isomerase